MQVDMPSGDRRFFILTGGPGAGKTALLDALARRGLACMAEAGRAIIRDQVATGGNALPWADAHAFAELMLARDIEAYRDAEAKAGPVLFDRGILDTIGYRRLTGLPVPSHCENAARIFRYHRTVFAAVESDLRKGCGAQTHVRRSRGDVRDHETRLRRTRLRSGGASPRIDRGARGFRGGDDRAMYLTVCRCDDLVECGLDVAAVDKRLVVILWPKGGTPRAFQGFCPHKREPLTDGLFDGKTLVCRHHDWVFDAGSGRCIDGARCRLAEYPLRVEEDMVLIDVEGVEETYL